jgi:hypothetical protein
MANQEQIQAEEEKAVKASVIAVTNRAYQWLSESDNGRDMLGGMILRTIAGELHATSELPHYLITIMQSDLGEYETEQDEGGDLRPKTSPRQLTLDEALHDLAEADGETGSLAA